MSVPSSWTPTRCNFTQTRVGHVSNSADIVVNGHTNTGYVEHHTGISWDTRGDGIILPHSVITEKNVSTMLDMWTEYRYDNISLL